MQIDYTRRMYWEVLGWLTLAYFVIEILINYIVFKQMSVKSDFFAIEAMEFWGKIVTGIGAGLVLSKTFYALRVSIIRSNSEILYGTKAVKVLLLSFLVCIPLSFYLQDKLIDVLVEKSTTEDRNKAILVVATQATMKPHYHPLDIGDDKPNALQKLKLPITRYKEDFRENYTKDQNLLFHASKGCVKPSGEALGIKLNVDKAFFAFNAFKEPLREDFYKQVITDYYSCVLDDASYQVANLPEPTFDDKPFRKLYAKYKKKTEKYIEAINKANNSIWSSAATSQVDKEWSKQVNKFLGFEAEYLSPYLSYENFVTDDSIQKYMRKHVKESEVDLIPYSTTFVRAAHKRMVVPIKKMLPNTAIPTYTVEGSDEPMGNTIKYAKKYDGKKFDVTQAQIDQSGKQAYKGIIMPIVALGASLTFLLINMIILVTNSVVGRISSSLGLYKAPLGLNLLIGLVLLVGVGYAPVVIDSSDGDISHRGRVVKTIYYYERALTAILGLYEKDIDSEYFDLKGDQDKKAALDKYIQQ